jgi:hypothetical protein
MPFLERGIDDLTREDMEQLVRDQVVEDSQVELKREIEVDAAGRVKDASRNDIAREIVGFANSDGGTLIIGIEESQDEPKRAAAIRPALNCHELAERLRRAVYEIVEPKLPILHVRAIETNGSAGVIVIVVAHSRRAPHRVESLRDCFRRVGSETRKMSMREIQELTLTIASEADRLNKRFEELASNFSIIAPHIHAQMEANKPLLQLRVTAIPLNPLWLGRVVDRKDLAPASACIKFNLLNKTSDIDYPWGREHRSARPIVRGERRTMISKNKALIDEIYSDGAVTLASMYLGPRIYLGWILTQFAALLTTIEKLRRASGNADVEYALEMALHTDAAMTLKLAGSDVFDDEYGFEPYSTKFPRYSYGQKSEQSVLINEMSQDILHSTGCRVVLNLDAKISD